MTSGEQFCLRYKDFESNIRYSWTEFQVEKEFCDVTLACDDKQIDTHKFIISSFSPVLKNILKKNPHNHPLIYLKGVKYKDLENMINFMHQGEVNIAQEDLNCFLLVAEDLKIKGLSGQNENKNENNFEQNYMNQTSIPKRKRSQENYLKTEEFSGDHDNNSEQNEMNPTEKRIRSEKNEYIIPEINIMPVEIYKNSEESYLMKEPQTKEVNEQFKTISNVPRNAGGSNYCEPCDKQFGGTSGFSLHNSTVHEGVRYSCDRCTYKATRKSQLKVHISSIHEGVRHPCSLCDFTATEKSYLTKHIKKVHN